MKKVFSVGLIISIAFSFQSCVLTTLLWSEGVVVNEKEKIPITNDTIYSFLKTQNKTKQIDKDTLIMVGKKYWYVVDKLDFNEIYGTLNAKLPKAFTIKEKHVPIEIEDDKLRFSSFFILNYEPANAIEKKILKDLDFSHKYGTKNTYEKWFLIKGKIFLPQKNAKIDYTFQTPLKASLYSSTYFSLKKVALTPIAVAGDVILIPLYTMAIISVILD